MLWRRTTIAAVLLAIASGGAGAAEPVRTLAWGILRIGTYFVNPPFDYMADGADIGFEVDLMEEIARRVGLKPAFVNTRWETILQEMQDGRYDCIVGGITITPQREQILAWSVPYITTTLSLVVSGAKTPTIRGLADLKDASVGVQAATTDYDAAVAMQKRGEIGIVKVYHRAHSFDTNSRRITPSVCSDLISDRDKTFRRLLGRSCRWFTYRTCRS